MKRNLRILFGGVNLLSIIALEIFLIHYFNEHKIVDLWSFSEIHPILIWIALFVFIITALANKSLIRPKENFKQNNLKMLIKNTILGNPLDIIFVIFFLLQMSLLSNALFEAARDLSFLSPVTFFTGLLLAICIKPEIQEIQKEGIILFTPISDLSNYTYEAFLRPVLEVEKIGMHIDKIIVFLDPNIKIGEQGTGKGIGIKEFDWISLGVDVDDNTFTGLGAIGKIKMLMNKIVGKYEKVIGGVEFVKCDYNKNVSQAIKIISEKVEEFENIYRDDRLIFHLTPGTKTISMAMMINSLKGNKVTTYIEQSTNEYLKLEIDKDSISEILSDL